MRVALVSDMHGNAVAFRAALADLEQHQPELIVSLGDVAQGGPQPRECIELLQELECPTVLGNTDEFLVTLDLGKEQVDDPAELERVTTTARWSRGQIGDEGLEYLRGFTPTVEAGRILCCHATPESNEDVVLPDTPPEEVGSLDSDAVAAGHVHQQWLRRFGDTLWFCVGAIGTSRHCEYALADTETLAVEFRRIAFDAEELVADARSKDFPYFEQWAAQWRT